MGTLNLREHWLEHQEADFGEPEHWVIYQQDACGKILPRCIHTDTVDVTVEPETGRLILNLGTTMISCSSGVAASVVAAIASSTEVGLKVTNAEEIARIQQTHETIKEQQQDDLRAALDAKQREVSDLDSVIEQKRIELADVQTQIDEEQAITAEATSGDLRQP